MPTVRVDCPVCGHVDTIEVCCSLDSEGDSSVPGGTHDLVTWEILEKLCACTLTAGDVEKIESGLVCEPDDGYRD